MVEVVNIQTDDRGVDLLYHWFYYMLPVICKYLYEKPTENKRIINFYANYDVKRSFWTIETAKLLQECNEIEEINGCKINILRFPPPKTCTFDSSFDFGSMHNHQFLKRFFTDVKRILEKKRKVPSFPKLVYLTRTNMKRGRCVINNKEVLAEVSKIGFEYVDLEKLSIFEKLCLFENAACILSPQSAGLIFLPIVSEITNVIEIYPNNGKMLHYYWLCKDLGIKFTRVSCLTVKGPMDDIFNGPYNFIVDAKALRENVSKILAHS